MTVAMICVAGEGGESFLPVIAVELLKQHDKVYICCKSQGILDSIISVAPKCERVVMDELDSVAIENFNAVIQFVCPSGKQPTSGTTALMDCEKMTQVLLPRMRAGSSLLYLVGISNDLMEAACEAYLRQMVIKLRYQYIHSGVRIAHVIRGNTSGSLPGSTAATGSAIGRNVCKYTELLPEDLAECIRHITSLPPSVCISEIEVFPTDQVSGGFAFSSQIF
ncbi:hypothetical protein GNI_057470 [Gregarina niphandrodes]|uniref:Uncharacterized protein n=1 Tax=Gregarina niphandrodes TaxID=110365 RepID=A0A023B8Q8_GRENI|nr:hypothetical protein GNI_057470 [Gregarina niphandrodes]EZG69602.1 hypothetical protein GNI_057470 [Gregarina niphandrodes]|eukprot:XP_011129996.1 hypothetical protein GNI_057470 [Gregarina niphandrodes]